MLALPIQGRCRPKLWGWPAVMISARALRRRGASCLRLVSPAPQATQAATVDRAKLPGAVLLPVTIAGIVWGAMNLACILFFSYAHC